MGESTSSRFQSVITEGILIALASAYVYLVTFFYELGYCTHFGIPAAFISPNITTILVAAAGIGGLVFSSLQFLGFSVPLIRAATNPSESQKPYRQFFGVNAFLLVFGILLWRTYGISWYGFLIFSIGVLLLNFLFFGLGLIIYRKEKSLRDKFEAMCNDEQAFNIWGLLIEKIGRGGVGLILILALTTCLAYLIGNGEAVRQKKFLVLKEPDNYALLRTYGDLLIAAPIDKPNKLVENDLLLLRVSSQDRLEFKLEMVGPLERKPDIVPSVKQASPSFFSTEKESNPAGERAAQNAAPSLP